MATRKVSAKKKSTKATVKKKTTAKKNTKKASAKKKSARIKKTKGPIRQRANFRLNEYVVYPAHGVGQIMEITTQEIDGQRLEFFVIRFKQERMVLRVPVNKVAKNAGASMRKLADKKAITSALNILKRPAKVKRVMWSRRAKEYEFKINSGNFLLLCEVVRDLYRADHQPEQSYSERQLYEAAFDRLMHEVAAAQKSPEEEVTALLLEALNHPSRFSLRGEVKTK